MTPQEAQERIAAFETRRANRELSQATVLRFLKDQLPQQYELAEVVGSWLWLEFPKDLHRAAANTLWRLGFHWNQKRCVWQHPCGAFATYSTRTGQASDPRQKFGCHLANHLQPA